MPILRASGPPMETAVIYPNDVGSFSTWSTEKVVLNQGEEIIIALSLTPTTTKNMVLLIKLRRHHNLIYYILIFLSNQLTYMRPQPNLFLLRIISLSLLTFSYNCFELLNVRW